MTKKVATATASNTRSVLVGYDTMMFRFISSNNNTGSTTVCRRTFFTGRQRNTGSQKTHNSDNHHRNRFFFSSAAGRDPGLEITSVVSDPKEVEAPRGLPSRAEQVRRLQSPTIREDGSFDILVIGGGATGAGIALDAAQRGLQTACIERGDFASETSSRSTKLIWVSILLFVYCGIEVVCFTSFQTKGLFLPLSVLFFFFFSTGWYQIHGNGNVDIDIT